MKRRDMWCVLAQAVSRFGQVVPLVALGTMLSAAPAAADDDRNAEGVVRRTVECGGFHLVRVNSTANLSEMFTSNLSIRNRNTGEPVVLERLTIYDLFGDIVFDGGAAAGTSLPVNTDVVPALDVSVVPPNASYYLSTKHVWGLGPVPAGNQNGFNLSLRLQYATRGRLDLVTVVGSSIVRQRVPSGSAAFVEGDEHTRVRQECQPLK